MAGGCLDSLVQPPFVCINQCLFGIVPFLVAMGLLYSVCAVLRPSVRTERHFSGMGVEILQGGEISGPAVNSTAPSYVAGMAETHTRPAFPTSFAFFREKNWQKFWPFENDSAVLPSVVITFFRRDIRPFWIHTVGWSVSLKTLSLMKGSEAVSRDNWFWVLRCGIKVGMQECDIFISFDSELCSLFIW